MTTPKTTASNDHFNRGTGASAADMAVEGRVKPEDRAIHGSDAPHARPAKPLKDDAKHDQMAKKEKTAESRQEALLDEGIEESFPSSDPPSVKRIT